MVTDVAPVGVLADAENLSVTVVGSADTDADGVKLHVIPAGSPLAGHASVTVPLKDPAPVTRKAIPAYVLPCCTETLVGEGAPSAKSTTCKVTGVSCTIADTSVPIPCTLNR